ncbi:hypothetical protein IFU39_13750 [Paenibacillus sp. CFBP 13594]|uniref:hypothetical protein n=1 Tax=Paenibacillus sp. CFBP 13594 TaxID=2774037 RepID=UPI0017848245|nr:hypothetical protein [Paenibacillus sp. CFBP 13594]MBD8838880.1 hypothetical protein [Paenibacillus sp. CFBP 13594]
MKYISKIFKNPIGIGVTTAVLSTVISTPIVAYVKSQPFSDAFVSIFKWAYELVKSILTFGVPLWTLLLSAVVYFKLIRPIEKAINKTSSVPDLLNYRNDTIDGIRWEWDWVRYNGKYNVSRQIAAVCTTCNGYLVEGRRTFHINTLECENCGYKKDLREWEHEDYREKIKREILRRVRNQINENSA